MMLRTDLSTVSYIPVGGSARSWGRPKA